jgi:hypothetical protein
MLIGYEALISVYRSARRVDTEIAHPTVWDLIRTIVRERYPVDPSRWLGNEPMRRHHYRYGRDQLLLPIKEQLQTGFETIATRQAVNQLGLCDPDGAGSVTHPNLRRMLYADGKVVTPLWRAKAGDTRVDKRTGELRALRFEADASLHVTGSGEPAWGTKHVMVASRGDQAHSRVILSVASVPEVGGEATVALDAIGRLAPLLPGALGVIYDGAFRGKHLTQLLHDHGLLPIVPVTAAAGGRHARKPRVERTVLIGSGTIRHPDGTTRDCILYTEAGALCLGELTANGDVTLIPLERTKIEPRPNADGTWRWYGAYTIPTHAGGGTLRVRVHADHERRLRAPSRDVGVHAASTQQTTTEHRPVISHCRAALALRDGGLHTSVPTRRPASPADRRRRPVRRSVRGQRIQLAAWASRWATLWALCRSWLRSAMGCATRSMNGCGLRPYRRTSRPNGERYGRYPWRR